MKAKSTMPGSTALESIWDRRFSCCSHAKVIVPYSAELLLQSVQVVRRNRSKDRHKTTFIVATFTCPNGARCFSAFSETPKGQSYESS